MAAKYQSRKRFFVDYRVQGALIVRIVLYWLLCLATMAFLILGWGMIKDPGRPLNTRLNELSALYTPVVVVSLILLPGVIFDLVRMSNRFAGPVYRLRGLMRDLARGKPVEPVRFRHGDFWQEFADDFNTVAAQSCVKRNSFCSPEKNTTPGQLPVLSLDPGPMATDSSPSPLALSLMARE